jgi:peptidoglycan/xylan/chitin deacetylase (PgdA/CDA1 family)
MPELFDAYRQKKTLPPRSLMITFDDAYRNFAECAWPILNRYKLPATVFVPTAFPDRPEQIFWWDRLYHALYNTSRQDSLNTPVGQFLLLSTDQREQAYKSLRNYVKSLPHREALAWVDQTCDELEVFPPENDVLSWQELRQLANEGLTLGAHTQTHPLMTRISPEEAQAEAVGSLHDLEQNIGQILPIFAYPDGRYNEAVVTLLRKSGFVLAFTTVTGTNNLHQTDWLRLRRINIGPRATLSVLRTRLLHSSIYLNQFRSTSGPH